MRGWIGRLGLEYAVRTKGHRGKFTLLRFLDRIAGPFPLRHSQLAIDLMIYLQSQMDTSYFRPAQHLENRNSAIAQRAEAMIAQLQPGDFFLDVGAHIGVLSLLAARRVGRQGRVLAVEPSRREHQRLLHHIRVAGLSNISAIHAAAGAIDTVQKLSVSPHHSGLNRLALPGDPAVHLEDVPVFRVDTLLARHGDGKTPALVKIDVEGAEMEVLSGMRGLLETRPPPRMVVEISPDLLKKSGSSQEELYAHMKGLGYMPTYGAEPRQQDEVFTLPSR